MKKKSTSQSAFFNLRVLIGLSIVLAGVVLALIGLGTFSGLTASSAQAQQKHKIIDIPGLPPGFDCSTIYQKGFHKMESLRAGLIMIACGEAEGGSPIPSIAAYPSFSRLVQKVMAPLAYVNTLRSRRHSPRPTRIIQTR
jgi:multisubunit Na+/H+ antiporter MnhC subunit